MTILTREDRLLDLIEDAVFEAEDELALAADGREISARAREVIEAASSRMRVEGARARVTRRRARRNIPNRTLPRRQALQRLLVANPRARKLAGLSNIEPLTDDEIEELAQRLAAVGLLPASSGN